MAQKDLEKEEDLEMEDMEQKLSIENGANQAKTEKGERFKGGDGQIGKKHRFLSSAGRFVFHEAFTQIPCIKGESLA